MDVRNPKRMQVAYADGPVVVYISRSGTEVMVEVAGRGTFTVVNSARHSVSVSDRRKK